MDRSAVSHRTTLHFGQRTDRVTPTLYTFGYNGMAGAPDIKARLEMTDVQTVVDVRYERGHGDNYFSEELMEDTIRRAGFAYYYDKGLGNPDYKVPGSRYPNSKPATRYADRASSVPIAARLLQGEVMALMCVCPKALHCHRRLIVADLLEQVPGLRVHHL